MPETTVTHAQLNVERPSLLIVDDDPLITETLGYLLSPEFDVSAAATRSQCIDLLRQSARLPAIALVDLGLPPTPHRPDQGFALIAELLAHAPEIKIVVLSGQNDESNARHARALGAAEFVAKPADPGELKQTLLRLLAFGRSATAASSVAPDALVGDSLPMQRLRAQARQYANLPFSVLIDGESGSGKEVVAHGYLHLASDRRERPYFALNCAAISPNLVEPTLFGYARGAFTGANAAKAGYFEDAGDGTLFLDEIGELPLDIQHKLLRILENGEFQCVGETQSRLSRCRVIAATNRDLRREVRAGRFRADLYHRLSVFTVTVPPLREMGDDRLALLEHFHDVFVRQTGQRPFRLDAAAMERWRSYAFPGNVRELRNIVIRLLAKHPGMSVGKAELDTELDLQDEQTPSRAAPPQSSAELTGLAVQHLQARAPFRLDHTLQLWEQAYIDAALRLTHGNVSQAAKMLGINRTTLYNRMETLARSIGSDAPLFAD